MNAPQEDFEQLRKLLALKRCEQPPPGYFNHFADKVIARIESEGLTLRASWWQRLFPELDARPVLACAYGLMITGLLVVGLGVSQSFEPQDSATPMLGSPSFAQTPAPAAALPSSIVVNQPLTAPTYSSSSVNPIFTGAAPTYWFDADRSAFQKTSYTLR